MFFTSIKDIYRLRKEINRLFSKGINRLRKEIDRLLSKGMSNICLKVTIEKNWCSQNLDFLSLKNLSQGQILLNFKTSCCNLKIRGLGAKLCVAFPLF